uniref:Brain acid soluble protein 1 n=1 Tax=Cyclopterus lumpus TaxID=8103 RepID=A0A8C2ZX63_CYCLU
MGGKLSKKKKGYNVNDDKAKDKDATAEGASAEESEAPKDGKDEAPAAGDAKEVANDTAAKEAPADAAAPKEEEEKNLCGFQNINIWGKKRDLKVLLLVPFLTPKRSLNLLNLL